MIQEIIDRLKLISDLSLVGGSAEIDPDIQLTSMPAAFVVLGGENAGPNTHIGAVQQVINAQIVVLLAVHNVTDPDGVESLKDLKPVRAAVKASLIGWEPTQECDPIIFISGRLLQMDEAGVLWWVDTFGTSFIERHV